MTGSVDKAWMEVGTLETKMAHSLEPPAIKTPIPNFGLCDYTQAQQLVKNGIQVTHGTRTHTGQALSCCTQDTTCP